jgi:hypothetical protein
MSRKPLTENSFMWENTCSSSLENPISACLTTRSGRNTWTSTNRLAETKQKQKKKKTQKLKKKKKKKGSFVICHINISVSRSTKLIGGNQSLFTFFLFTVLSLLWLILEFDHNLLTFNTLSSLDQNSLDGANALCVQQILHLHGLHNSKLLSL